MRRCGGAAVRRCGYAAMRVGDGWYFLVTVLDAYSRYMVHWELLATMAAADVRYVI